MLHIIDSQPDPQASDNAEETLHDRLKRLPDPASAVGDQVVAKITHARLHRQVDLLPALERQVIRWHFGLGKAPGSEDEPLSIAEIGDLLNMPRVEVRRIRDGALNLLRQAYGAEAAA